LFGAGAALRASIHSAIDPADQLAYDSKISALRRELGKDRFAVLWEEGQGMTLDRAVAYALEK
jgi:hypothetical protein